MKDRLRKLVQIWMILGLLLGVFFLGNDRFFIGTFIFFVFLGTGIIVYELAVFAEAYT